MLCGVFCYYETNVLSKSLRRIAMDDEKEYTEESEEQEESKASEDEPTTTEEVEDTDADTSDVLKRISELESRIDEVIRMVGALADAGSLAASVEEDNEEDEYPTLDLDNLMGD